MNTVPIHLRLSLDIETFTLGAPCRERTTDPLQNEDLPTRRYHSIMLNHDWIDTGAFSNAHFLSSTIFSILRAPGTLRPHCLLLQANLRAANTLGNLFLNFFQVLWSVQRGNHSNSGGEGDQFSLAT